MVKLSPHDEGRFWQFTIEDDFVEKAGKIIGSTIRGRRLEDLTPEERNTFLTNEEKVRLLYVAALDFNDNKPTIISDKEVNTYKATADISIYDANDDLTRKFWQSVAKLDDVPDKISKEDHDIFALKHWQTIKSLGDERDTTAPDGYYSTAHLTRENIRTYNLAEVDDIFGLTTSDIAKFDWRLHAIYPNLQHALLTDTEFEKLEEIAKLDSKTGLSDEDVRLYSDQNPKNDTKTITEALYPTPKNNTEAMQALDDMTIAIPNRSSPYRLSNQNS